MRWFKPVVAGNVTTLFGAPDSTAGMGEIGLADIRELMLAYVKSADTDRFPLVAHRIRHAADVEALWFLRGDLMALLASSHGEAAALRRMATVSAMFEKLLPEGLRARPSLLMSGPRR